MIPVKELEDELSNMIVVSPVTSSITNFCELFSGKEKLINLYDQYCNRPTIEFMQDVSYPYFITIISSMYVTFKIGKFLYVDFDERIE